MFSGKASRSVSRHKEGWGWGEDYDLLHVHSAEKRVFHHPKKHVVYFHWRKAFCFSKQVHKFIISPSFPPFGGASKRQERRVKAGFH